MTFSFMPASDFVERVGLFISLTGGTNSGKTFSAMRLARGIAGPQGKMAVLDTEGGRTLHLKDEFRFDVNLMSPPFRPERFADAARDAEKAGYAALVIDSFSMEWAGLGGVLDWQSEEIEDAVKRAKQRNDSRPEWKIREANKMAAWIKPKTAHKSMVYALLQCRIPIVFSIRGEESVKPGENGGTPTKIFKSVCNAAFPFEVTVSFRLETERKGYLDLSDPKTFKLEGFHQPLFKHGDRISEDHGRLLAEWACGTKPEAPSALAAPAPELIQAGDDASSRGSEALKQWWAKDLTAADRAALGRDRLDRWKASASEIEQQAAAAEQPEPTPAAASVSTEVA